MPPRATLALMTLLAEPTNAADDTPAAATPLAPWVPVAVGALGAVASLVTVVAATVAIWAGDAQSPGTWQQALGAGSALWLGIGGASLTLGPAHLSFLPLLLALVPLATAVLSARWLVGRREESDGWVADLLSRPLLRSLALWWIGYAVSSSAAVGLAFLGPFRPVWWTLGAPLLGLPLVALALVLTWAAREDEWLLGPRLDGSALPVWLRRAVWPAVQGAGLLLGIGAAVAAATVALGWGEVTAVQAAVGGGGGAATVLWLVQGASLPNFALWALSFLSGPGFAVVDGASTTWSGSRSSLMPLVPVLAALPQPRSFPWWVALGVLVPVAAGWVIGRWAVCRIARLSSVTNKLLVSWSSAVGAALLLGLLDVVGGSSLGAYRLSQIGAPAGWLTLALAVELVVGAAVAALWDAWRLRR